MIRIHIVILSYLILTSIAINQYEVIDSSAQEMKVIQKADGSYYMIFVDRSDIDKSYQLALSPQLIPTMGKTAFHTTQLNSRWNIIELSSGDVALILENSLFKIYPNGTKSIFLINKLGQTNARILSLASGNGDFFSTTASGTEGMINKVRNDGSFIGQKPTVQIPFNNIIDCAIFNNNYPACFYSNCNGSQFYVKYDLWDIHLNFLKHDQINTAKTAQGILSIRAITLENKDYILVVTMRDNTDLEKISLNAMIVTTNGILISKVSPTTDDFEILTECNKDTPHMVYIASLTADKFVASCKRVTFGFDYVQSIIKYDTVTQKMTAEVKRKIFSVGHNIAYYIDFNQNGKQGPVFYLIGNEIRVEIIGAPRCETFTEPDIFQNTVRNLNFDSHFIEGKDQTKNNLKIQITSPMNNALEIMWDSNPININQPYDTWRFNFNSGGTSGGVTYAFQVVSENGFVSKNCDIMFNVLACYTSCYSCSRVGDSTNMNCILCDTTHGYYPLRSDSSKCYNADPGITDSSNGNYALDNGYWEKCYTNCLTCSGKGTNTDMKCSTCNVTYYPLSYDNRLCYQSPFPKHFLDGNKFYWCDISCASCLAILPCTTCDKANLYFLVIRTTDCINDAVKLTRYPNYYFNAVNKQYEPCYSSCGSCTQLGTLTDHKCTTCASGTIISPIKSTDCVTQCVPAMSYWYINSGQYTCTANKNCPPTNPIYVPDSNQCVQSCQPTDDCLICKNGSLSYYKSNNDQCVTVCPPGTTPDSSTYTCSTLLIETCQKTDSTTTLTAADYAQTTDSVAFQYANAYSSTDKQVNFISNENYKVVIYKNEECVDYFDSNISKLDLENCINQLRKEYGIPSPIPLITLKMDLYRTNQPNQVSYKFYSPTGTYLDMAPCADEKITVTVPINDTDGVNLTLAKELEKLGIDVFNASDPFFNSICVNFTSENGTDVPLKDRKNTYYQNASICEEGCTYAGSNLTAGEASCECKVKTSFITDLLDNPLTGELLELFNNANFEVLQCCKEVFTAKYFVKNIGGWIILFLIICQSVFLTLYIVEGLNQMKTFLLQYIKVNPPKKGNKTSNEREEDNKEELEEEVIYQSPNCLVNKEKGQAKPIVYNYDFSEDKPGSKDKLNIDKAKGNDDMGNRKKRIDETSMIYMHHCLNSSSKEIESKTIRDKKLQLEIKPLNLDNDNMREIEAMSDDELDELAYEYALDYDKRTFGYLYWTSLKDKHSIINAFFNPSPLESTSIKAMCFFYGIALYFTFNAVFYSESYISDQFASGESFNFITMITSEISRCLYSTMIGVFVGILLGSLSSQKYQIEFLVKRVKDPHKFRHEALRILKATRIKNIIFFVINYATMLLFWYFVSAFCYCFSNTQLSWLIGGLITWSITLLFPFFLCLLIATFRIFGLKCKLR